MASDALMNAYMALIPRLAPSAKTDIEKDMKGAGDSAGSKFGIAMSAAAKGAAAGLAAGLAALGKVAADAFNGYAQYEQIAGGIEQLFGKDSEASLMVQQFADDAYKTAGLSATAYMEQVTGFSAALLQSLDGDATKAAQTADRAIQDMADNANTFGTDISSIQAAYQGFAKGNFTMLDNLRIGFGGTREDMARLIARANELRAANGEMADLSIDSYADIVEAIHTVQTEMSITGKTHDEASRTIQGSLSAMKASWQNLLVGLASDEASLGGLVETFMQNVITFAKNALPRLTIIVDTIGEMLPTMIDMVIQFLSTDILPLFQSLIDTIIAHIPDFITAGVQLLVSIVKDLPNIISQVVAVIPDIIGSLVDNLLNPDNIAMFLDVGVQLIAGLGRGILQAIPKLLEKALEGLKGLVGGIKKFLGIASPSKLFAEIGDFTMQGMAVGIEDGSKDAEKAMQRAVSDITAQAQGQINIGASLGLTGASAGTSAAPITIQSLYIQADSTTTAQNIFEQIRAAAAAA